MPAYAAVSPRTVLIRFCTWLSATTLGATDAWAAGTTAPCTAAAATTAAAAAAPSPAGSTRLFISSSSLLSSIGSHEPQQVSGHPLAVHWQSGGSPPTITGRPQAQAGRGALELNRQALA